ncbi:hypothetical protein K504DRAFT_531581 [Pleomassaria siparia CBS 279.74]|uniref:Uncharacterized protein n=1 Tax=Pleomassaria siparia CBS 279.74 TaxID=1314801 RepID=A0A6G1KI83_9PLEO|nr:hypothetical protein K504DRAFT_531581 [Pleomassaria siparia CBS 279.74]
MAPLVFLHTPQFPCDDPVDTPHLIELHTHPTCVDLDPLRLCDRVATFLYQIADVHGMALTDFFNFEKFEGMRVMVGFFQQAPPCQAGTDIDTDMDTDDNDTDDNDTDDNDNNDGPNIADSSISKDKLNLPTSGTASSADPSKMVSQITSRLLSKQHHVCFCPLSVSSIAPETKIWTPVYGFHTACSRGTKWTCINTMHNINYPEHVGEDPTGANEARDVANLVARTMYENMLWQKGLGNMYSVEVVQKLGGNKDKGKQSGVGNGERKVKAPKSSSKGKRGRKRKASRDD